MATINETVDSDGITPVDSISVGDIFDGTLSTTDLADIFSVDLTTGLTYTLVLTGAGEADAYYVTWASTLSPETDGEGFTADVDNEDPNTHNIFDEYDASANTLYVTFVADDTGTYTVNLTRTGVADGDVDYDIGVYHGGIDMGTEGNDTIRGSLADQVYDLGDGDDYAVGGRGNDVFNAEGGNDRIFAGKDNDTVTGGTGDDTIRGMGGDDSIDGGEDVDRLAGGLNNDTIAGGDGNDRVFGNKGDDSLMGDAGDDKLVGGSGDDTLDGGTGDDYLVGSFGNDVFAFGADSGADTINEFTDGFDRIDVSALGITDISGVTIAQSGDNVVVTFSAGNEVTVRNATASEFDALDFVFDTLGTPGTAGDDTMTGTAAADFFDGLFGDDFITGADEADTLLGNDGRDTIEGGAGADSIAGGRDNDNLSGGADNDTVNGDSGSDIVNGDAGADVLSGGDGKDSINGGAGADSIYGGASNDQLTGGADADVFFFDTRPGDDFITDFEDGVDLIDLTALVTAGEVADFSSLTVTQIGGNTLVNLYGGYDLTLIGTDATFVTADDFVFV